jgi:hypothetical protein
VLPLASRTGSAIAQWLSPQFGEAIRAGFDDDILKIFAASL